MAASFETLSKPSGEERVLKVAGEVDMESAPGMKEHVQRALRGTRLLWVDLSQVSYLDSSGVAVLVQGLKDAQKARVDYRLLDPSPQVRAVIELAMLQQFFRIETSGA